MNEWKKEFYKGFKEESKKQGKYWFYIKTRIKWFLHFPPPKNIRDTCRQIKKARKMLK